MNSEPAWWQADLRDRLVRLLEADGDPHLQRLDDRTLRLVGWQAQPDETVMMELTFIRLTYGGCGAPPGCVPERVRVRGRLHAGRMGDLQ